MRFAELPTTPVAPEEAFSACLAVILGRAVDDLPRLRPLTDPADLGLANRWLGALLLGLVRVADPASFSWPGPWIALVRPPRGPERHVLMYGTPSGAIWDPAGDGEIDNGWIAEGYLVAAADVGAGPVGAATGAATDAVTGATSGEADGAGRVAGVVEAIVVSPAAGEPVALPAAVSAVPELGLKGDRYAQQAGTFPTGVPGSALTLIEAEVCESFDPPLAPGDHRRNIITRGVALNELLGREFDVGTVRCRGMRLCEPCTVVQRYAARPVLRPLAHRGGLRADILTAGEIRRGDPVTPVTPAAGTK